MKKMAIVPYINSAGPDQHSVIASSMTAYVDSVSSL